MPSIPGRLEWDDESLTPGQRQGGGLHSTLFRDGHLGKHIELFVESGVTGHRARPGYIVFEAGVSAYHLTIRFF